MVVEWPFVGTEALASGVVNRYQLATQYEALFRNIYVPKRMKVTPVDKAIGARLWSGRRGTAAGLLRRCTTRISSGSTPHLPLN